MTSSRSSANLYSLVVIGLISCSMLMYEILLMRISALRLSFHFGFLIISNCLLGLGASGTLISIYQDSWRQKQRLWITLFSAFYLASLILTYVFLLTFYIPANLRLSDHADLARFSFYNIVAFPPFFLAGTVIGMILTFNAERVNKVYFSDLVGAGLGCLLCPFLLWRYGAGGCFVFLALLALVGTVAACPSKGKKVAVITGVVLGVFGLWLLPALEDRLPVPGKGVLQFTKRVQMPIARITKYSRWTSNSRIDLVPVGKSHRTIFCRGRNLEGLPPIPEEMLILQDGDAGSFIVNFSENPESLKIIDRSMYATAMHLKDHPSVFVIGVGGGNDVWAAKAHDAREVRAVELNRPILDIHRTVLANYSRELLEDPRIRFECTEGRSALMQDTKLYDIIQMSGVDTWTALTSGSYVMAEDYLYTREAIESMYSHLAEGGILQIIRFSGPAESLRLLSNIYAAFEAKGIPDFDKSVICIRNPNLMCTLVKNGRFTVEEVTRIARFVDDVGLDVVYLPYRNSSTLIEVFVRTEHKASFIEECRPNIAPTTDDKPYFFYFSKWPNPLKITKYKWKPSTVFEVNPMFILLQLALSTVLSVVFIMLPLSIFARQGVERVWAKHFLIYFAGLGLGFIAIEIVTMQKLTLFLGHPIYSITVTLFSILIFTGLGSLLSARWFDPPDRRVWLVPTGLAILLMLFIFLSPRLVTSFIHLPLLARIAITICVLAPISLLLGVPFAYGIRLLNLRNPSIIPWAWAVNGCFSVVGSILTVILSMSFGFNAVLLLAVVVYLTAFIALNPAN